LFYLFSSHASGLGSHHPPLKIKRREGGGGATFGGALQPARLCLAGSERGAFLRRARPPPSAQGCPPEKEASQDGSLKDAALQLTHPIRLPKVFVS